MKKIFFYIFCILFSAKIVAQEFRNNTYGFEIKNDEFQISKIYDEDLYEDRRSICNIVAKGTIKKDEKHFYQLNSFHPSKLFRSKLINYENKTGLKDSLSITINISNFKSIDFNNFRFSSIYNVQIKEENDGIQLKFNVPKLWSSEITLFAYPKNENFLVSNDGISLSFSNQLTIVLFQYDFSSLKYQYNSFEFEIVDFDPCNLYLKYFDGDFIKIKNNKLYWKNMVFEKVR